MRMTAFLLAQLGAHAADRFAERIAPLDLAPRHVGLLRWIAAHPGASQREIAAAFGVQPSRVVVLVDELERRDLVQRHQDPGDRRSRSVRLTERGERMLAEVGRVFLAHQADLLAALTEEESAVLGELLGKVAAARGLTDGVHPGHAAADSGA